MKRFIKHIFLFLFLLFGAIWYPVGDSYVDSLFQREYSIYESEKLKFDSIETDRINSIKDSIYLVWLANNDTTLKTIKKINKKPNYDEHGYYRKTGKFICKIKDKDETICEPEKEWITTDYYINGYVLDTIWTAGYDNRNQWLNKANIFAQTETDKISPKKEFGPYKASSRLTALRQNYSYDIRNAIGTYSVLIFSVLILLHILYLIRLLIILVTLDTELEDVEDNGDIAKKDDKQETFMNTVSEGLLKVFGVCIMSLVGFIGIMIIVYTIYIIIGFIKLCLGAL